MSIGPYAFSWCSSLKVVVVLPTTIDIGSKAFYVNVALTRVVATRDTCLKVYDSCEGTCTQFRGCPTPSSAPTGSSPTTLPSSVSPSTGAPSVSLNAISTITCSSCAQCSVIPSYYFTAVIPSGVTNITGGAFYGCSRMTGIVIPT